MTRWYGNDNSMLDDDQVCDAIALWEEWGRPRRTNQHLPNHGCCLLYEAVGIDDLPLSPEQVRAALRVAAAIVENRVTTGDDTP